MIRRGLVCLLLAVGLAGCASPTAEHVRAGPTVTVGSAPVHAAPHTARPPERTQAAPVLRIPALGITAPIDAVTAPGGVLAIPDDLTRVGWYQATRPPGARRGVTLIAGHRDDSSGAHGALYNLAALTPGDAVAVSGIRFTVAAVTAYPKTALPVSALLARSGPPRLAIATCDGPLIPGPDGLLHYRDNTVVWAVPALL